MRLASVGAHLEAVDGEPAIGALASSQAAGRAGAALADRDPARRRSSLLCLAAAREQLHAATLRAEGGEPHDHGVRLLVGEPKLGHDAWRIETLTHAALVARSDPPVPSLFEVLQSHLQGMLEPTAREKANRVALANALERMGAFSSLPT